MRLYYRVLRDLCQVGFVLALRGRAYGREHVPKSGGAVLICNHQSFFDPVLAGLALPRECHFMARDSLFRNPYFGRLISSLNAFPVKRGTADVGALKNAMRRLKDDQIVVTFPEATRTRDGRIGAFHPGIVLMAKRAEVPVVTAAVHGAYQIWPRDARWPRFGNVSIDYGPGLGAADIREWEAPRILEYLRTEMLSLYEQACRRAERT